MKRWFIRHYRLVAVVIAVLALLSLLASDLYNQHHFNTFDSVDDWYGWLDEHLDYRAADGYGSFPAYLQAEAYRDHYLISQQILTVEGEGGQELHLGLMLEIDGEYYYTEPALDGGHATARLGASR